MWNAKPHFLSVRFPPRALPCSETARAELARARRARCRGAGRGSVGSQPGRRSSLGSCVGLGAARPCTPRQPGGGPAACVAPAEVPAEQLLVGGVVRMGPRPGSGCRSPCEGPAGSESAARSCAGAEAAGCGLHFRWPLGPGQCPAAFWSLGSSRRAVWVGRDL